MGDTHPRQACRSPSDHPLASCPHRVHRPRLVVQNARQNITCTAHHWWYSASHHSTPVLYNTLAPPHTPLCTLLLRVGCVCAPTGRPDVAALLGGGILPQRDTQDTRQLGQNLRVGDGFAALIVLDNLGLLINELPQLCLGELLGSARRSNLLLQLRVDALVCTCMCVSVCVCVYAAHTCYCSRAHMGDGCLCARRMLAPPQVRHITAEEIAAMANQKVSPSKKQQQPPPPKAVLVDVRNADERKV